MPKIAFTGELPINHDQVLAHIANARSLGLPYVRTQQPHGRRLAVVGGGPSIKGLLDEISKFDEIWAINGACGFLRDRGIDSTLLTLDPADFLAPRVVGATKGIVSTRSHPSVFETLKGAELQLFDVLQDGVEGGYPVWVSVSTASAAFQLATDLGFRHTVFYGCEGSFAEGNLTHAYMNEAELQEYRFVVKCGWKSYLTAPDLYMQTCALAPLLRTFRGNFFERSGGFLRAMLQNKDEHDITHISKALEAGLKPMKEAA